MENNSYYVYILASFRRVLYIGFTRNLRKRTWEHREGVVAGFTKKYNVKMLVYYEMYKPDGTQQVNSQGLSQFPLYDNGDTSGTGDLTAGDGRYSFKLTFPVEIEIGTWEFRFYAEDRSGALSNVISHNIEVN